MRKVGRGTKAVISLSGIKKLEHTHGINPGRNFVIVHFIKFRPPYHQSHSGEWNSSLQSVSTSLMRVLKRYFLFLMVP